jgi:hypothetical protein
MSPQMGYDQRGVVGNVSLEVAEETTFQEVRSRLPISRSIGHFARATTDIKGSVSDLGSVVKVENSEALQAVLP